MSNYLDSLQKIKEQKPLLHCISNIVTANDCANLALAIGASPIMAQAPEEMDEIISLSSAVVLNTGTPSKEKFLACENAAAAASAKGIPVVLDPVGIGASLWRLQNIHVLLGRCRPTIVRVNLSEAKVLLGVGSAEHGVDTEDVLGAANSEHAQTAEITASDVASALAKKLSCVVVLSGNVDYISDGERTETISGGSDLMKQITGAGCMLSVLCAAFASVEPDAFLAAKQAVLFWKICAAQAEAVAGKMGLGSFHAALFDAATNR